MDAATSRPSLMSPLCIMLSFICASIVGPLFMCWPVVVYGALNTVALLSEPKSCSCPSNLAEGRQSLDVIAMFIPEGEHWTAVNSLKHLYNNFNRCFSKDVFLFYVGK